MLELIPWILLWSLLWLTAATDDGAKPDAVDDELGRKARARSSADAILAGLKLLEDAARGFSSRC